MLVRGLDHLLCQCEDLRLAEPQTAEQYIVQHSVHHVQYRVQQSCHIGFLKVWQPFLYQDELKSDCVARHQGRNQRDAAAKLLCLQASRPGGNPTMPFVRDTFQAIAESVWQLLFPKQITGFRSRLVRALSRHCPGPSVLLVRVASPLITAWSEPCPVFPFSTAYIFEWLWMQQWYSVSNLISFSDILMTYILLFLHMWSGNQELLFSSIFCLHAISKELEAIGI